MEDLERRLIAIEERNGRVEGDKAWEVSWMRRISIAVCTYGVAGLYLIVIDIPQPWLSAVVPALGYLLSTLTLSFLKKVWLNKKV